MEDIVVNQVLLDGSVVLKMVKHCEEEAMAGQFAVSGCVYGLAKSGSLEISHCIPSPTFMTEETDSSVQDQAMQTFETDMVKHMRQVNIDYLGVGYYVSAPGGNFINRQTIDSLFSYQGFVPESVLVVYDPLKVSRGHIAIKSYRITKAMLGVLREATKEEDKHMKEAFRKMRLQYDDLLEEVPTLIRNSHLSNVLLADMEQRLMRDSDSDSAALASVYSGLNLSVSSSMERQLKYILSSLEKLSDDLAKNVHLQRTLNRGVDASRMDRLPQIPARLDSSLLAAQIDYFAAEANSLSEQTIYKLKVTKAIQEGKMLKD